jgi:hypothetical protein
MKNIGTLVEDIYGLFDKKMEVTKEQANEFGQRMSEMLVSRLSEERQKPTLRLSNLGKPCLRQLWYSIRTPELAEPLSGPARIKFLFGDMAEQLVLCLAKLAGHTVTDEQRTVEIKGVEGHIDAIIDGELTDVKSASPASYKKFENGLTPENDGFGYLTQLGAYSTAVGSDRRHFLVIEKVLGKLHLDSHDEHLIDYDRRVDVAREVLASNVPPERGFSDEKDGESGNRKLGFNCSYCDFKHTCWPNLRTIPYAGGPRFLTRVVKEPVLRGKK